MAADPVQFEHGPRRRIAVVGSGIAGLSCAWLLAPRHDVIVFEADTRLGGHSNTVVVPDLHGAPIDVDCGFIVYNEKTYPNLTALFAHLEIVTHAADMSLSIARTGGGGMLEYSGSGLGGLFAQKRNILRPRFWSMLAGIWRFYREAPQIMNTLDDPFASLGTMLDTARFSPAMQRDHLLPMASAMWSCSPNAVRDFPAQAFMQFCANHGLLQLRERPKWRSVIGGAAVYVTRMAQDITRKGGRIDSGCAVRAVARRPEGVRIWTDRGPMTFDDIVIATHAPEALALLADATPEERATLSAIRYGRNTAVLHEDASFMPGRRRLWSAWNVQNTGEDTGPRVTYWMNRLQALPHDRNLFVTLNPDRRPTQMHARFEYEHPMYDAASLRAQRKLWSLQGSARTWFCGAYFGAGFHEDGLQAGLAVGEALGGMRRPWSVPDESARITHDACAGSSPHPLNAAA
jgi:uncharacterized protein